MLDFTTKQKNEILCEQCGEAFEPRQGSGGKPQRFCSTPCRLAFHSEARTGANGEGGSDLKGQRDQRAPTCSAPPSEIDSPPPENPARAPEAKSDFDWSNPENVALQDQPATALYFNRYGALVIRQCRAWDQDEDTFVYISPENIDDFLNKITDACGIPGAKP